jgi:FixJ family two-component response regulator
VSGPLIAIIDDDDSMLSAIASLLRSVGFATKTYCSAEDFIGSGCHVASSCIITDIHMPGLSGIELKYWLNAHSSFVPVIMITARSEPHLKAQALASGAICFLKKPFAAQALLDCLKRAEIDLFDV